MKKDRWTLEKMPDLTGKTIIVTGANSGIGYEAAKVFAMYNATVIMGCRSLERGNIAKEKILDEYKEAKLDVIFLDLMDFDLIKEFANEVIRKYSNIDVLLNNAGIMSVPYGPTKNGLEKQIGVNHFGHFYLTMSLLDIINKTKDSRIVNVASIAHRYGKLNPNSFLYNKNNRYNKTFAYGQSKLANLLFTYGLASRLKKRNSNIKVLAAHPGVTKTNIGRHLKIYESAPSIWLSKKFKHPMSQGKLPSIRACVDPNALSGEYYGPDGLNSFRGFPVVVKSSKKSYSKELQDILWEHSVKITNLDISF